MAAKSTTPRAPKRGDAAPASVDALLASLDHPREAEIHALRRIVLGADVRIAEGIKWNAPSFRTSEWFATVHLRAKQGVQIILHLGAKKRSDLGAGIVVADPGSMLVWLAEDRATVTFRDLADVEARGAAFASVVRAWIGWL